MKTIIILLTAVALMLASCISPNKNVDTEALKIEKNELIIKHEGKAINNWPEPDKSRMLELIDQTK